MNNQNLLNSESSMLLYQAEDGHTRIEVQFKGETVWLSLNQMADLFQRDKSVISMHIRNVFDEGELTQDATVAKYATVQTEGSRSITREIEFYNLDVIISVGYRVKSHRGTQFRIWATQQLKEYIIKGFAMDDRRLKMPEVAITSKNCSPEYAISEHLKRYSGGRFSIFTQPVLTMIRARR